MHRMECDHSVYRSAISNDVKRLNIVTFVMLYGYDSSALDSVIIDTINRVLKITLVNAIPFFRDYTGNTITQPTQAIGSKNCFVFFVKNRDHTFHHLGLTLNDVIVLS